MSSPTHIIYRQSVEIRRLQKQVDDLLARLKKARTAIASLDKDALGIACTAEGYFVSVRDELLRLIDKDIAKAEGEK